MTNVDLLVFGPHPDDIEIGLGGTVALHVAQGFRAGLCDLTRGELGSNGTVEDRLAEAEAARAVLGADWRLNLGWPDGGVYDTPEHVTDVVRLVRACRPEVVAIPYWNDRHPDHRAASETLTRAVFKAGLRRFSLPLLPAAEPDRSEPADASAPWRPRRVCYYFINDDAPVSFGLDVSEVYDKKRQALACHRTQFAPEGADRVPTRLTASTFRQLIESRDAHLGALTGVAFAEGLIVREPLLRPSLFDDRRVV
ncbi:MAG TPA: bacillithiol biosynthesis deacetylase BshB1 [Vicinamibacterales bacterium]|nr:bacillithiol biosynthesis deacetylase BshB1 [Vicinamibacterales bacterium]